MFYYRLIETNFRGNHFSYVIIDEASQAIEPEMLIPLMITNFETEIKRPNKETEFQAQIVIAGDPYQLGPAVRCKRIEHLLGKFFQNGTRCHVIYIAIF